MGGASFNSGIFLATAAVDRALMGSMVGERMNRKRSEGEGDELRDFKGREPLLLLRILPFHNVNVGLSISRMQ
jgi:hypothetical protein